MSWNFPSFSILACYLQQHCTTYIQNTGGNQAAATNISFAVVLAFFVGIVIYHIRIQLRKTQLLQPLVHWYRERRHLNDQDLYMVDGLSSPTSKSSLHRVQWAAFSTTSSDKDEACPWREQWSHACYWSRLIHNSKDMSVNNNASKISTCIHMYVIIGFFLLPFTLATDFLSPNINVYNGHLASLLQMACQRSPVSGQLSQSSLTTPTYFHCWTSILHPHPLLSLHSTPTSIAELPFYTHFPLLNFHFTTTPKFAHVQTSVASSPATHTVLTGSHIGTSLKPCVYVYVLIASVFAP